MLRAKKIQEAHLTDVQFDDSPIIGQHPICLFLNVAQLGQDAKAKTMIGNQMQDVFPIKGLKRPVEGSKGTADLIAENTVGIHVLRNL